jgi:hypothetical protein
MRLIQAAVVLLAVTIAGLALAVGSTAGAALAAIGRHGHTHVYSCVGKGCHSGKLTLTSVLIAALLIACYAGYRWWRRRTSDGDGASADRSASWSSLDG